MPLRGTKSANQSVWHYAKVEPFFVFAGVDQLPNKVIDVVDMDEPVCLACKKELVEKNVGINEAGIWICHPLNVSCDG